jgi:hypothetical protein
MIRWECCNENSNILFADAVRSRKSPFSNGFCRQVAVFVWFIQGVTLCPQTVGQQLGRTVILSRAIELRLDGVCPTTQRVPESGACSRHLAGASPGFLRLRIGGALATPSQHWNDAEQKAEQVLLLVAGQFHRCLLNIH